ncbi:50S ribosomal protein L28 [Candidatus Gottesmanbacteria bacterium RIFCSPLOWO2_01_FULL_39_12b]|uniref:Large ribosomal subunit protein bL28 n=1 Tax=Candidatus Gottesmanbacteria bacterium RIFCSPLOWO2_01_FULL_39_12b TaxID=1798388 RepID=A0A1F6AQY7_9BACT|nr:MAG: 50S ribosomal protein L28 [Candidatus Gottesmanbacteria bacterium RIFCSPLOWO2_01_FULL_39_12b]
MSLICEHCHKGVGYGHAVSHAKNRTRRLFKPNLQKIKGLKSGVYQRVKLCTSCIKRLKKDGRLGVFSLKKVEVKVKLKLPESKVPEAPKKVDRAAETLKIEEIVGKKS